MSEVPIEPPSPWRPVISAAPAPVATRTAIPRTPIPLARPLNAPRLMTRTPSVLAGCKTTQGGRMGECTAPARPLSRRRTHPCRGYASRPRTLDRYGRRALFFALVHILIRLDLAA